MNKDIPDQAKRNIVAQVRSSLDGRQIPIGQPGKTR